MSGSIVPLVGLMANSTVHLNPCRTARIFASIGSASSERYSSSPLRKTMCLPLPGPCLPSYTTPSAAPVSYHLTNIRDFSTDKHRKVDKPPTGGGPARPPDIRHGRRPVGRRLPPCAPRGPHRGADRLLRGLRRRRGSRPRRRSRGLPGLRSRTCGSRCGSRAGGESRFPRRRSPPPPAPHRKTPRSIPRPRP